MSAISGRPSNNPHGRPAGSLNRISGSLRQKITQFLEKHWGEVEGYWKQMTVKDKMMFIKDILPYASPRLQSSTVDMMLDVSNLTENQLDDVIKKMLENATSDESQN
jgi:20S proteasome alpha/beta subunit